jgi:hypothetical protein
MPEANVLYSVTAAVVLGLVAWVAVVLKTAKEPWARAPVAVARTEDVAIEPDADADAKADADADAKAEAKADAKADADDAKADADDAKAKADDAKA